MLTAGTAPAGRRSAEPPEAYLRDGFVAPIRVLSDPEARLLRTEVEALAARPVVDRKTDFRQSHLIYGWADRLVRHPSILDAVEDVLGPNILVWRTNFFVKPPSSPQFVSWHQGRDLLGPGAGRRHHRVARAVRLLAAAFASFRAVTAGACCRTPTGGATRTCCRGARPPISTSTRTGRSTSLSIRARCPCTTPWCCTAPRRTERNTRASVSGSSGRRT